jgi:hypothetical protein
MAMESDLLRGLVDKSMTKEELSHKVRQDFGLLPLVLKGTSSSKATIRYGCSKVLMDLAEEHPEKLYPHMDFFIDLLDGKYRILTWNALTIIANLAKVDKAGKLDAAFNKYFGFINVGNSGKIALAKPHLIEKITNALLKVENLSTTPHLTEECRRVIAEATIKAFNTFYPKIKEKEKVIAFVRNQLNSPRKTLRETAETFLHTWENPR